MHELMQRIISLRTLSGAKYTTEYLKEAVRLFNHVISGHPDSCPAMGGVRVASRRGLPLIIPGTLRLLIEAGDTKMMRVVLTYLSIYRIIKYPGVLKLATIYSPFTGAMEELPAIEVALV